MFLLILSFLALASAAFASPVSATVTITGNCTVYEYSYLDKTFTPLYTQDTPAPCAYASGTGELRPDGFWISSSASLTGGTTGETNIRTSMALDVVVLGGTGSGSIAGSYEFSSPWVDWPVPAAITRDFRIGGQKPEFEGAFSFSHPIIFGEPIRFTVDTNLSITVDRPSAPGDPPGGRGLQWRMQITDIFDVDEEHGHIIGRLDDASIVEAAAIPEPAAGLLCGFGLLLFARRLRTRRRINL